MKNGFEGYDYNMDECNENDSSLYLCHDPCPPIQKEKTDYISVMA